MVTGGLPGWLGGGFVSIITHVLAALGGGFVGVIVAACCVAAGREDEAAERTLWPEDKQHSGLLEKDE